MLKKGLDEVVYEFARKEIVESYGYDKLLHFSQLEACGFIKKKVHNKSKEEKGALNFFKELFGNKEQQDDHDESVNPDHPYDGHDPISSKLLEMAVRNGWQSQEIFDIEGPMESYGDIFRLSAAPEFQRTILYYMIGGITYAEVACLRRVARQLNIDLIIATTDIITSKDIIKLILH